MKYTTASLTPTALTNALRSNGYLHDTEITEVKSEQIGQDLGFNGSLWRLFLTYDSAEVDGPNTLIAKFPLEPSIAEKSRSEARFYREFTGDIGIRIPRGYVAEPEMLLLEDLSDLKCGDVVVGCSANEALLFVRHLARFHATGWMKSSITNHEWLPSWPIRPEGFYPRFREFHPIFLKRFESLIPAQISEMTLRLVDQIPQVVDELSQAPPTLIHVDTHLDNILFDPPEVVLIDWPSAAVGPAAIDFTRFISTSMPTPVRRSVADRLLNEYLEVLHNCGVRNYGLDDLRRYTTLAALRLWAGITTGYGGADPSDLNDRQRELQKIEIQRMIGFAEDWRIAEFLEEFFGERPDGRWTIRHAVGGALACVVGTHDHGSPAARFGQRLPQSVERPPCPIPATFRYYFWRWPTRSWMPLPLSLSRFGRSSGKRFN